MSEIGGKMYDVMLDEMRMWLHEYEPPLRKQKLEAPPSPVEDDYFSDEDMDPVEQETYRLQVMDSCGFDVDFFMHTFNGIVPSGCSPYDKLFAKEGPHCYNLEKGKNLQFKSVFKVSAEIGMGDATVFWDFDAIDEFYEGDMPDWPLDDAVSGGDKLQFYEVKESELQDNEWLYLYAEVALFSEWDSDMSAYTPFEMKM